MPTRIAKPNSAGDGEPPRPGIEPRATGDEVAQALQGGIVESGLAIGRAIEPHAEEVPLRR